jgi:4-nitrophenyl phosphatase
VNLAEIELFIFDLDGVVYLGNEPVPKARETLEVLEAAGKKLYYLTNNSTKTRKEFQEKLSRMGIQVQERQIITSASATAQYLRKRAPGAAVYIIGEQGLVSEFQSAGFQVVTQEAAALSVSYVVVGMDRGFTYQKLATALTALVRGAKFIATNPDPTLPTEHGILPGAGSMVAALSTASRCEPTIVIGKPNPFMVNLIMRETQVPPQKTVIIGDRYITDIKAGINAQINTILVKTGTGIREMKEIPPEGPAPDLILESIAEIPKFL